MVEDVEGFIVSSAAALGGGPPPCLLVPSLPDLYSMHARTLNGRLGTRLLYCMATNYYEPVL